MRVEESIPPFQLLKLVGYDSLERRANQSAFSVSLRHPSDEQINIVHRLVQTLEMTNDLHDTQFNFQWPKSHIYIYYEPLRG